MSLTTLAGTVWKMNDTVDFSVFTSSSVPYFYRATRDTTTVYMRIYTANYPYNLTFNVQFSGYSGMWSGVAFSTNGMYVYHTNGSANLNNKLVAGSIIQFLPITKTADIIGLDDPFILSWFESNGKLVSVFDFSSMDLPDGTYSVTTKALAQDYLTSPESSSVELDHYDISDLSGTTWRFTAETYRGLNNDPYYQGFSGKVSYGDYVIDNTAQRWSETSDGYMRFSNTDVQSGSSKIYPLFFIGKDGIQVQPSSSSSKISIPYVDVYIAGQGQGYFGKSYNTMTNMKAITWFKTNSRLLSKS